MIRFAVVGAGWIAQEAFMPGVAHSGTSTIAAIGTGNLEKSVRLAAAPTPPYARHGAQGPVDPAPTAAVTPLPKDGDDRDHCAEAHLCAPTCLGRMHRAPAANVGVGAGDIRNGIAGREIVGGIPAAEVTMRLAGAGPRSQLTRTQ